MGSKNYPLIIISFQVALNLSKSKRRPKLFGWFVIAGAAVLLYLSPTNKRLDLAVFISYDFPIKNC